MDNLEEYRDLKDFLQISWTLPKNEKSFYNESLLNGSKTINNMDKEYDIINCLNTSQCLDNESSTNETDRGNSLVIDKFNSRKINVRKESASSSMQFSSCPYYLRRFKNESQVTQDDSVESQQSNSSDPDWQNKLLSKKKAKRGKCKRFNYKISKPLSKKYSLRRNISSTEPAKFNFFPEGLQNTEYTEYRRNGKTFVRRKPSYQSKKLFFTEPAYYYSKGAENNGLDFVDAALLGSSLNTASPVQNLENNNDYEDYYLEPRSPKFIKKKHKKMATNDLLVLSRLELNEVRDKPRVPTENISKPLRKQANLKVKMMLLDVNTTLNQIDSSLTDWKYSSRIPTIREASNLLKRVSKINSTLTEEFKYIKCKEDQIDLIDSMLDLMRKSEDLHSAIEKRIKKLNRIKIINTDSSNSAISRKRHYKMDKATPKFKIVIGEEGINKHIKRDANLFEGIKKNTEENNTNSIVESGNVISNCPDNSVERFNYPTMPENKEQNKQDHFIKESSLISDVPFDSSGGKYQTSTCIEKSPQTISSKSLYEETNTTNKDTEKEHRKNLPIPPETSKPADFNSKSGSTIGVSVEECQLSSRIEESSRMSPPKPLYEAPNTDHKERENDQSTTLPEASKPADFKPNAGGPFVIDSSSSLLPKTDSELSITIQNQKSKSCNVKPYKKSMYKGVNNSSFIQDNSAKIHHLGRINVDDSLPSPGSSGINALACPLPGNKFVNNVLYNSTSSFSSHDTPKIISTDNITNTAPLAIPPVTSSLKLLAEKDISENIKKSPFQPRVSEVNSSKEEICGYIPKYTRDPYEEKLENMSNNKNTVPILFTCEDHSGMVKLDSNNKAADFSHVHSNCGKDIKKKVHKSTQSCLTQNIQDCLISEQIHSLPQKQRAALPSDKCKKPRVNNSKVSTKISATKNKVENNLTIPDSCKTKQNPVFLNKNKSRKDSLKTVCMNNDISGSFNGSEVFQISDKTAANKIHSEKSAQKLFPENNINTSDLNKNICATDIDNFVHALGANVENIAFESLGSENYFTPLMDDSKFQDGGLIKTTEFCNSVAPIMNTEEFLQNTYSLNFTEGLDCTASTSSGFPNSNVSNVGNSLMDLDTNQILRGCDPTNKKQNLYQTHSNLSDKSAGGKPLTADLCNSESGSHLFKVPQMVLNTHNKTANLHQPKNTPNDIQSSENICASSSDPKDTDPSTGCNLNNKRILENSDAEKDIKIFSLDNINYLRIPSKDEFVEVDNLEDFMYCNSMFIW